MIEIYEVNMWKCKKYKTEIVQQSSPVFQSTDYGQSQESIYAKQNHNKQKYKIHLFSYESKQFLSAKNALVVFKWSTTIIVSLLLCQLPEPILAFQEKFIHFFI